MGVMIDCNWIYWDAAANSKRVGWPYVRPYAYQRIADQSAEFRSVGFASVGLPPSCECGGGTLSAGYDLKNNYSYRNTAFGTEEMMRQAIAVVHANGMQAYGDLVFHQYGGYANGNYTTGRFPKTAKDFSDASTKGGVQPDPVPDSSGNFPFGDEADYLYSTPGGYMYTETIKAAMWQTATLDFDGYRIDDVKGTYVGVVRDAVKAILAAHTDEFFFGEFFSGMTGELSQWVNYDMSRTASILDFGFKFNVGNICNNNSNSWMGALANIGWCQVDASTAVTFVESADTDTSPGEQVIWNKMLGYAIMLTFPGYPRVYYRDWSTDENCYGLKDKINNLIWIHENLAQGEQVVRWDNDPQVFIHERLGYERAPGCLAAFNNDQWNEYTRTVQTNFGTNQRVHEYTGNGGYNDIYTDGEGRLTITLPKNDNGMGYLVYALPNVEGKAFTDTAIHTTQMIEGAADLAVDGGLGPAITGTLTITPRLWVAAGSEMSVALAPDVTGWVNTSELVLSVTDPAGNKIATLGYDAQGEASQSLKFPVATGGWHTLALTGTDLPEGGASFKITATYLAEKGI